MMAMQDVVVPEAESISARSSGSENEESLSSAAEVKTTLTVTIDTAVMPPVVGTGTATKKHWPKKYKPRVKEPEHEFPVAPRVVSLVHRPKSFVDQ
jgi:hypothetical protein